MEEQLQELDDVVYEAWEVAIWGVDPTEVLENEAEVLQHQDELAGTQALFENRLE